MNKCAKAIDPRTTQEMVENWYSLSPNGKSSLFVDSNQLKQIYEEINVKTNYNFPAAQLTCEEEAMMRTFYHTKIRDICGALEYSLMVEYDAHSILHGYFTKYGILDYDIKHVMLACIYIGTKTQNMHLSMDNFISKIPNTQPDLIIQMEVIVLAANDFRPPQFSSLPCLYGYILDSVPFHGKNFDFLEISQKALDRLQVSFMIDEIMLVESPAHIALACVLEFDEIWEKYFENRLRNIEDMNYLRSKMKKIQEKIKNYSDFSPELLRPIDRKIRLAQSQVSD